MPRKPKGKKPKPPENANESSIETTETTSKKQRLPKFSKADFEEFLRLKTFNTRVNPRNIESQTQTLQPRTKKKYIRLWKEYVQYCAIGPSNLPTEENLKTFFNHKREHDKCAGSTLKSYSAAIKWFISRLYKSIDVKNMPQLGDYINSTARGEKTKQAKAFTADEFIEIILGIS